MTLACLLWNQLCLLSWNCVSKYWARLLFHINLWKALHRTPLPRFTQQPTTILGRLHKYCVEICVFNKCVAFLRMNAKYDLFRFFTYHLRIGRANYIIKLCFSATCCWSFLKQVIVIVWEFFIEYRILFKKPPYFFCVISFLLDFG